MLVSILPDCSLFWARSCWGGGGGAGSVAIGQYIGYTGYGGGDLHIPIRMAHSR